jgi:hypothetical protein
MRKLQRHTKPSILIDRGEAWLSNFMASGNKRPDSSKYAHTAIKTELNSMSFHKCFYCETKLKGEPKEVDHHVEVSVDKTLSYTWENLYLSCDNCNNKIPHDSIPVNSVLNPCLSTDDVIQQHLTFNKELINPKDNSELGLRTIQKFRLDTELLDTRRLKQICLFQELLLEIRRKQIEENRNYLDNDEINAINAFSRIDNPFSLMFKILIDKLELN